MLLSLDLRLCRFLIIFFLTCWDGIDTKIGLGVLSSFFLSTKASYPRNILAAYVGFNFILASFNEDLGVIFVSLVF